MTLNPPPTSRLHGLSPTAIQGILATANALELGRADEAGRHITPLLALYPQHPEVLRLQGGVYRLNGDAFRAVATLRQACDLRRNDAIYLNTLGTALTDIGDYDAAIAIFNQACAIDPKLSSAAFNLGVTLVRSMRPTEAVVAFRRALDLAPGNVDAQSMLAEQLKASGRIDEAITEFRRILTRHPRAGMAWWGLADIKSACLDQTDIQQMELALRQPGSSVDDRIATGFALAKANEDCARYADSLAALATANNLAQKRMRWDGQAHRARVEAVLAAFTPPPQGATDADLGKEVLFVASLPRSGSTLIEHILASHSQVDGGGELPDLPLVLTEESQRRKRAFPNWTAAMLPQDWSRLGQRYLERTARWRQRKPRFTDKLPYNWFYVGAVRAMLPGARIIIARRDPLETCFSCYRQLLVDNEYTRNFADLAGFWRDFDRSVKRWLAQHPDHVYESRYEHLVADPEAKIRDLLDFCGLPFERACVDFHQTDRAVHTPSSTQVREPLRRDTARSPRYGALLDPLRAELGYPPFSPASNPNV